MIMRLMKALRAETDRVTHIESTITNIQNSYQERVKRKGKIMRKRFLQLSAQN